MSETLYHISFKADPSKTAALNWQNASELVAHGFWEWADGGTGSKQFATAKKDAKVSNTKPQGFEHLDDVAEDGDEDRDDDDTQPVVKQAPVVPHQITVTEVAKVEVQEPANDPYVDMSRDELFAAATKLGLTPDKRLGTKNLITLLRQHEQGAE